MKRAKLIIDLQFGSTGKGLIAGYLALRDKPDTLVTAWAANAGHTYIDMDGRKYIHTMLANGIVSPNLKQILIGPGSLINPVSLMNELKSVADILEGRDIRIFIHPQAAIITQKHIDEEQGPMTKIGSTKKGVGAAMIDRIRRNPDDNNVAANGTGDAWLDGCVCSVAQYNAALDDAEIVQIEGAQGYSLSMYHGMYPYTTSRDVTPAQIFADCAIPMSWWENTEVVGTMRTFPIRVANRFDETGTQVGYSGNCYPDQQELEWSALGMEPELTTVTKLPRRIFTLSKIQLAEAIRQCSVDTLFINFVNYCRTPAELNDMVKSVSRMCFDQNIELGIGYMGFGPTDHDIINLMDDDQITMDDIIDRWMKTAVVRQSAQDMVDFRQNLIDRANV